MPRLNPNDKRLEGPQIEEFTTLLRDAYSLNSFDIMLRSKLGKSREDLALGNNFKTIVYRVIEEAEQNSWTAELLQATRAARQTHVGLLHFAQQFALEPSFAEPERLVRTSIPEVDPEQWFADGMARLGQVCRVEVPAASQLGTGFLIGPDLVLTNYHVVAPIVEHKLASSYIHLRFDQRVHSKNPKASLTSELRKTEWLVDASSNSTAAYDNIMLTTLDYALLRTTDQLGAELVDSDKDQRRGWIAISPFSYTFLPQTPLLILGHPRGESLKLALDTDSILSTNAEQTRIRYTTNTDPGSSGSPCFDMQWKLVALHHAGDLASPPQYNQGIPLSAIRRLWEQRLQDASLAAWQKASLQQLLDQNFPAS